MLGDSQLVVRHLLRLYKRSTKPSLYLTLEGTKALVKKRGWKVSYRYVPRELNTVPDDMCGRARAATADVEYREAKLPVGALGLDLDALYAQVAELASGGRLVAALTAGALACYGEEVEQGDDVINRCTGAQLAHAQSICSVWDERLRGVVCRSCGLLDGEEDMAVCDRCESPYHAEC